ncbi:hypothetical protein E2562_017282 [Oryza meyeriana var. granulata]|uniref:Uncharacterized protein n=1 Tax=Oryza meyeriana var. granulata TaxID=110450 RepID=A0A6G1ELU2_9ORYZ|nr:hypothetical protein E2562_017282 [Oryza meyeriana var. granulata]
MELAVGGSDGVSLRFMAGGSVRGFSPAAAMDLLPIWTTTATELGLAAAESWASKSRSSRTAVKGSHFP